MSDDNVITFDGVTRLAVPVERVLQEAIKADLSEVVISGMTKDGEEYYFASSEPDGPSCLWLLEKTKMALLRVMEDEE